MEVVEATVSNGSGAGYLVCWEWCSVLCLTEVVQAPVSDGCSGFFAAGCHMLLLRLWCTAIVMTEIWQWKSGKKYLLILSNKTYVFSSLIRMFF